jgi:hypothetical protein
MPKHGRGRKHLRQRAEREAEKALMPEDSKEGGVALMPGHGRGESTYA